MPSQRLIIGNSLEILKGMDADSIDVCVTSPPYWGVRDYGSDPAKYGEWEGQLGLEPDPRDYVDHLCMIFDEVKRVLRPEGACWVNIGDTYSTVSGSGYANDNVAPKKSMDAAYNGNEMKKGLSKYGFRNKSLCQIPSRFAIAMTDRGWILRNEIIWHKPNPMPVSVTDRFTVDFEKFFFFTKSEKYHFVQQLEPLKHPSATATYGGQKRGNDGNRQYSGRGYDAAKMEGKNRRTIWTIAPSMSKEDHSAMFPMELIDTPIKACCPEGGTVLDPFCGSGTTLEYCRRHDIDGIGIEINPAFKDMIERKALMDVGKLEEFI